jgi:L-amino acid N-acyltransferase YncA
MFRRAEQGDLSQIQEIFNYAIEHTTALYEYELRNTEFVENWFLQKQKDGFPVLVFLEEEKVVGFGTYGKFRPHAAYKFTIEHSLYVHPEHFGKGYGKQILNALIELAKEENYHTMIGGIDSANETSIRLHEKYGFEKTAELKQVGYKFERWLDLTFMQLLLS